MVVVGADVHESHPRLRRCRRRGGSQARREDRHSGQRRACRGGKRARERFGVDVIWAIDVCRHVSRLERDLFAVGQTVVRVLPKLMAQARASARTRGKSDPIEALTVARGFLREPDLPVASVDKVSRDLKLLVDRREDPVAQRTATINQRCLRPPAHRPRQPLTALPNGSSLTW